MNKLILGIGYVLFMGAAFIVGTLWVDQYNVYTSRLLYPDSISLSIFFYSLLIGFIQFLILKTYLSEIKNKLLLLILGTSMILGNFGIFHQNILIPVNHPLANIQILLVLAFCLLYVYVYWSNKDTTSLWNINLFAISFIFLHTVLYSIKTIVYELLGSTGIDLNHSIQLPLLPIPINVTTLIILVIIIYLILILIAVTKETLKIVSKGTENAVKKVYTNQLVLFIAIFISIGIMIYYFQNPELLNYTFDYPAVAAMNITANSRIALYTNIIFFAPWIMMAMYVSLSRDDKMNKN